MISGLRVDSGKTQRGDCCEPALRASARITSGLPTVSRMLNGLYIASGWTGIEVAWVCTACAGESNNSHQGSLVFWYSDVAQPAHDHICDSAPVNDHVHPP